MLIEKPLIYVNTAGNIHLYLCLQKKSKRIKIIIEKYVCSILAPNSISKYYKIMFIKHRVQQTEGAPFC